MVTIDDVTGIVLARLVPTGSFTLDVGVAVDVSDCGTKTAFEVAAVEIRDAVVVKIDGFRSRMKDQL